MTLSGGYIKSTNDHEVYPKVLVVGESFHTRSGGGITQSNLFKFWPKDKIAIIPYEKGTSDPAICNRIYNLTGKEIKYSFPFGLINKLSLEHKKENNEIANPFLKCKSTTRDVSHETEDREESTQKNQAFYINSRKIRRFKYLRGIYRAIIGIFGINHVKSRLVVSIELLNWIQEFNPEVIYAQFATLDKIRFVNDLRASTNIPLVLHFMDDWPSVLASPGMFHNYWERIINNELIRLIDSANACIAISERMATEYKSRYNKNFTFIHNPVDVDKWLPFSKTSWEMGATFKILYAGRAGGSILKSLKTIADSVQDLNESNLKIEFHIYTKDFINTALVFKNVTAVHVHEPIPDYNQLPNLFSSHDLLLIPLEFDSKFLRLSMPTKVSEYMISGTPIMVFAPRDTALAEYALKYHWAYVIDNDKQSINNAIRELYYNESLREKVGLKAKELADLRHNAVKIRSYFKDLLLLQTNNLKEGKNDNRNILSEEKVNQC